jgi:DNA repair exonuclease SbcCD ATPase subunit
MANTKEYKIVINGLQESINAVESLNKQLDNLEQRINALQAKNVSIGTGSKGTSKSSLSEEEKLAKQIEQIDAKREAFSKKIYQNYLAAKDVLKETVKDQQQIAASERLQANVYSNTMKGLKDKLADIKNVMQTTEIGSDIFKKYTAEANEITNKLKELEEAYGQFGRNVGN